MSMLNMLLGAQAGKLTLFEQVFNASGTFTMPSDVVNNQVVAACTGGGGGGYWPPEGANQGGGGKW